MEKGMQRQIFGLFRQTDQMVKKVIRKKVEDTGLYRSQHRLLMILGNHLDASQSAIAEKMDVSPAAVAVTLKKLESAGYIRRQSNEEDNRVNRMEITDKGKKAIHISRSYFEEIDDALLQGFSHEEMELLKGFFLRMIDNGENYYQTLLDRDLKG